LPGLQQQALIFSSQTTAAENGIGNAEAFCLFLFLIVFLAMMEGGQGALVGLQPTDKTKYDQTHKICLRSTQMVHKNGNMERFIVGRQLMVVLVVFMVNLSASAIKDDSTNVFGIYSPEIFFLCLMMFTIIVGQLTGQVNSATCMLDFCNNYLVLFIAYLSLAIEYSGLLHSVYLAQVMFERKTKLNSDSAPVKSCTERVFFWWVIMHRSCAVHNPSHIPSFAG
jgi:hypothetical protein